MDESIDQQLVQLGMGKDIELHDEMRIGNDLRNFTHLRPPTSSSTLPTGRVHVLDGSFETDNVEGVNFAVKNIYMRFDERKWASTLLKVVRHMRLMERTKYLEPHFSLYVLPIAKYLSAKFKLCGSAVSSYSSSQVSGNNNRESVNGANWKQYPAGGMDVVLEEE